MTDLRKYFFILVFATALFLPSTALVYAFQLTPPRNIVHKQKLPLKDLNFIRTKEGITYLLSDDGRYVFQGALFDVWNGEQIESIGEMEALTDRVSFDYIGVTSDKMFTLDLGTASKEAFVFSDPNCSICHNLIRNIRVSKLINKNYRIKIVITPLLKKSSMEKTKKLAGIAEKDQAMAVNAFIENSFDNIKATEKMNDKIDYNLLVARALSIHNFPYIVNSQGRMHIGIPDDIYLFLSKQ